MNRLKREFRARGLKLECDYPALPYDLGSQSIHAVEVNSETATAMAYYSSFVLVYQMRYDGAVIVSHED